MGLRECPIMNDMVAYRRTSRDQGARWRFLYHRLRGRTIPFDTMMCLYLLNV